jgi:hypothetical protein
LDGDWIYSCVLDYSSLISPPVVDPWLSVYTDNHVYRVFYTNCLLKRVPSFVFTEFPNLEYLSLANTGIADMEDSFFGINCIKLRYLDLSYNNITGLNIVALEKCANLEVIWLTGNNVSRVDVSLQQALRRLITIVL